MKKITTSILIALFSVTIFTPAHVEASWLSKTWKKVEKSWNEAGKQSSSTGTTSTSSSTIRLPQRSEYPSSFRYGQVVGQSMDIQDFTIAGVPVNAKYSEIRKALGVPTEERMYDPSSYTGPNTFMRYGGIKYSSLMGDLDRAGMITIENRDAVTYRGISVGDSLDAVYQAYGRPNYINSENDWFYGYFVWASDAIRGIYFENDEEKVTKIRIVTS